MCPLSLGTVLVQAVIAIYRLVTLNRNLFVTVSKDEKSKIKVVIDSSFW